MGVENMSKGVAIVGVHGVAAHPRYEFQDQVAGDLCMRLNERDGEKTWKVEVVNPKDVLKEGTDDPLPTTTRIMHAGDDIDEPKRDFFDVIEAYWSPIDKGATNWFSVLMWIFQSVFAPFNTTARVESPFAKQFFDYGFIGGALVVAFVLFAVSITEVWLSAIHVLNITGLINNSTVGQAINVLNANAAAPGGARIKIVVWIFVGILGAISRRSGARGDCENVDATQGAAGESRVDLAPGACDRDRGRAWRRHDLRDGGREVSERLDGLVRRRVAGRDLPRLSNRLRTADRLHRRFLWGRANLYDAR